MSSCFGKKLALIIPFYSEFWALKGRLAEGIVSIMICVVQARIFFLSSSTINLKWIEFCRKARHLLLGCRNGTFLVIVGRLRKYWSFGKVDHSLTFWWISHCWWGPLGQTTSYRHIICWWSLCVTSRFWDGRCQPAAALHFWFLHSWCFWRGKQLAFLLFIHRSQL